MMDVPAVTPVTTPVVLTVALPLLELHTALATVAVATTVFEPVKGVVLFTQTEAVVGVIVQRL